MFPARAGMSPPSAAKRPIRKRVPRASGDEPASLFTLPHSSLCSPRERG